MKNIIIGGGPAGVTAAYELSKYNNQEVLLFEKENYIGGISATLDFNGNKVDLGPHRFFTKSEKVQKLWEEVLPLQGKPTIDDIDLGHTLPYSKALNAPDPQKEDDVLLYRPRLTRIYYRQKFFNYPVSLSLNTIKGLGFVNIALIGISYFKAIVFKRKEISLEDFFINRFGFRLYQTFFKDYTEKLWGISCEDIPAEWGAQRVKGISILQILKDIVSKFILGKKFKTKQTSMIEAFYYPKLGSGQMYEKMANQARVQGAQISLNSNIIKINLENNLVKSVIIDNNGCEEKIFADNFFSSMPINELIEKMGDSVPDNIKKIADELPYRNVRLAAFKLKKLKLKNTTKLKTYNDLIPDVWIYIQEKGVKAGRMEIINNFSPYLVKNNRKEVCITVEYFCSSEDGIWQYEDDEFLQMAFSELEKMNIAEENDFIDQKSFKIEKAYPAYFGSYKDFDEIKKFIDSIKNLYPMGRNGMHKYNNMDHSILTAMESVSCLIQNGDKAEIWNVNTEQSYQEEK